MVNQAALKNHSYSQRIAIIPFMKIPVFVAIRLALPKATN
jgi:hypothetical protein